MKVAVAVHGRFHGFDLARELYARDALAGLLTTYPAFACRRFLPDGLAVTSAPLLELVRRLHGRFGLGPSPHLWIGQRFARFVERSRPAGTDVLVGWSGATLEAIEPARRRGIKVVLERGSSHIAHQADVLAEEYARHGLSFTPVDPRMVARECAEYAAADLIAVPTSFAARTFIDRGVAAERLVVNPYGVNLDAFSPPPPRAPGGPVRVLFVGRVGLRKGLAALLNAAKRLGSGIDLRLVGPLEAEAAAMLAGAPDSVTVVGPVPGSALPAEYRAADIFCLPSLEEGLPLTLLQAMASGLAAVVTPETGAQDMMESGIGGLIVPSGDGAALAEALARLAGDAETRIAMGRVARQRVAAGHGWSDYGDRAMAAYGRLLGDGA